MPPNTQPHGRNLRRIGSIALLCCALLGAWALHGEARAPLPSAGDDAAVAASAVAPNPASATPTGTAVTTPSVRVAPAAVRPAAPPPAEANAPVDPKALERREQARDLLRMLRSRMGGAELMSVVGHEVAASQVYPYVEGWVDTVLALDPELALVLASDIDALLCDPTTTPTKHLVLQHLLEREPSFAGERGAACARSASKNDVMNLKETP